VRCDAYEIPAYEMHARKMHTRKIHAREMYAREVHAHHQMHAHEIYAHRSVAFSRTLSGNRLLAGSLALILLSQWPTAHRRPQTMTLFLQIVPSILRL